METKQEVLSALQGEFERWEQLLSRLGEDRIVARNLPSELSIKDVMAHLTAWQELSLSRLEAALKDTDPAHQLGPAGLDPDAEENLEQINAWIHETYADVAWSTIYQHWRRGYQRLLDLGRKIPEDILMEPARYHWLRGLPLFQVLVGAYEHHHDEHYLPLAEWLRRHGNPE